MKRLCLFLIFTSIFLSPMWPENGGDSLSKHIRIEKRKDTVYELLNYISEVSGFYFIYDSKIIDNEKKAKLPGGSYSIREAINFVLQSGNYTLRTIDRYILINKTTNSSSSYQGDAFISKTKDCESYKQIAGTVLEKMTQSPIPYCSVGFEGTGIGTITNNNGKFVLRVPDSLLTDKLHVSHIGYDSQSIPISFMQNNPSNIYLSERIVPLQEVIFRLVNPRKIVKEALEARDHLYLDKPSYFTSFYREGIMRKSELLRLTEAVFKVYKQSYSHSFSSDQVKLLKMRKITNDAVKDSVVLRMKAGVEASLLLDLMKNVPDFLEINDKNIYDYTKIDMTEIDSRMAHVISFEQRKGITDPYLRGKLFIDSENSALLCAQLEVNPQFIDKAEDLFVVKRGRSVKIHPQQIVYTVSYKELDGKYYMNHVRGDLQFKMKGKGQLFYSSMHIFFEMVTCKVETVNVQPFPREERLPVKKIFSEERFAYDNHFWGDFNVILPEENINKNLSRITSKIEESGE
ncbi:carboxypeptidase-like regulatory domain-containing protein [uncultured Bacteroides sp.]|uniref:carboxypeptidase-like regulatory domain-containing protein n=1 Tax=uncultured Bacteroides sp. TaxID=162156 RepID=UPI002AAB242D|nr:carboxypeptidase-like regulatory domain-containing protein [uncultured Bacteroides sp.]